MNIYSKNKKIEKDKDGGVNNSLQTNHSKYLMLSQ